MNKAPAHDPESTSVSAEIDIRKRSARWQTEMTKFKKLWHTLSEDDKEYWRGRLISDEVSNDEIRAEIFTKYEIDLKHDRQLYTFRQWEKEQRLLDLEEERMHDTERRYREQFPNATKEQIRDHLLIETYKRTTLNGNFPLGLQAIRADTQLGTLDLNREKFKESVRTKINAGIDMLREEAGKNPVVKAAIEQLRAATAPE